MTAVVDNFEARADSYAEPVQDVVEQGGALALPEQAHAELCAHMGELSVLAPGEPYTRIIVDAHGRRWNPELWSMVVVCSVTDGRRVWNQHVEVDDTHHPFSESVAAYYGGIADQRRKQGSVIERMIDAGEREQ